MDCKLQHETKIKFEKFNISEILQHWNFLKLVAMETWHYDHDDDNDAEEELRDHSFGGKDAILFLIDASPKMHQTNNEGEGY